LTRTAAQAALTNVVLSQGAPLRTRVERRLPALSSLRGQNPAQERRWASVANYAHAIPRERQGAGDALARLMGQETKWKHGRLKGHQDQAQCAANC
jgi:hypothetical protein